MPNYYTTFTWIISTFVMYVYCQREMKLDYFNVHCGNSLICKAPVMFCNRRHICDYCEKYCQSELSDIPQGCHLLCFLKNGLVTYNASSEPQKCNATLKGNQEISNAQLKDKEDSREPCSSYLYIFPAMLVPGNLALLVLATRKFLLILRKKHRADPETPEIGHFLDSDTDLKQGQRTEDGKIIANPQNDR